MNQTESNVYDKLLYYVSHEGEVRWEKFKDAINRLTDYQPRYKPFTYLKFLARLGHLDFDPMQLSHVAIAPAVLIDTVVENRYVLVGSRIPAFLEEIKKCVSDTGGKLRSKLEQKAPTSIVLSELTEVSFTEIENLGIHISRAFSAKLSRLLPNPKRTSFSQIDTRLPDSRKKFNLNTLKYGPDNQRQQDNGLYEIPQYGSSIYILKSGTDLRKVPPDWGEWLALSDAGKTTGLTFYVERTQTWCVKYPLHLPLIVDRCATLCSGYPPKLLKNYFYHYSDVPIGVACQLTKSLYQTWEVV